jgi:neutral ceramidase
MHPKKITFFFAGLVFFAIQLTFIQVSDARAGREIKGSCQEKVFLAGAATSNITPSLNGGRDGSWSSTRYDHIHDELHARCLVLDDGETRLAFVVVDLVGLGHEIVNEAKRRIEKETNIPKENVIISATHNHSVIFQHLGSPPFNDYQEFKIRRITDAVRTAIRNLEPARIGWGVGSVPQHLFVRRWIMSTPQPDPFGGQEKARMNPVLVIPIWLNRRACLIPMFHLFLFNRKTADPLLYLQTIPFIMYLWVLMAIYQQVIFRFLQIISGNC